MIIKFPKEEENFSPQEAIFVHKILSDDYFQFLKLQSKCEFYYMKVAGFFFFSIVGTFILKQNGTNIDPLIAISVIGLGCLLVFSMNATMDLQYATSAALCVDQGVVIEKKYANTGRLFRIFEDNKTSVYKVNLLMKVIPFGFIGLSTLSAGTIWAQKAGTLFAIIVAFLFSTGISMLVMLYIRLAKRAIYGANRQA